MQIFKRQSFYYALILTLIISLLGKYLSSIPALKLFGHLVIALILGMIVQISKTTLERTEEGALFISNKFLRLGIILLGFKLALDKLLSEGKKTLLLAFIIVLVFVCIIYVICRLFKVEKDLALLSACGCSICGAAAVMGVSSQVKAKTDDSVLAVAVVAILGTVFTLIEVTIKPYLGLTDYQYGIFTGSSLHEIAHAVAAGGAGGQVALDTAILAKLSRVLMLIVVVGILIFINSRENKGNKHSSKKAPIPYFILGFVLTSIIGSYVPTIKEFTPKLVDAAYIFLGMAMAALGMNVNFNVIVKRGGPVFVACFLASCILLGTCYLIAKFIF